MSSSCLAASSFGWQHFLYFLPLPQWQGSLRPGLAILVNALEQKDPVPCTQLCRQTLPSMICCLLVIGTSPINSGEVDAWYAEAHCIGPTICASPAGGCASWALSTICGSVCAAHGTAAANAKRRSRCAFSDPRCIWRR